MSRVGVDMVSEQDTSNKYRFGPRDKRGLILGVSVSQAVILSLLLLGMVLLIRAGVGLLQMLIGTIVFAAAGAAIFVNFKGKPPHSWLPIIAKLRKEKVIADFEHKNSRLMVDGKRTLPKELSHLKVVSAACEKPALGLIKDRKRSSTTVVIGMSSLPFALLGEKERDRQIRGWSQILSAVAYETTSIKRIQWVERTLPDQGEYLAGYLKLGSPTSAPMEVSDTVSSSYRKLLSEQTNIVHKHDVVLSCTFGAKIDQSAILTEVSNLLLRCQEIGFDEISLLSAGDLNIYLRQIFDVIPNSKSVTWPWPQSIKENWSYLQADGMYVASYSVVEWPRMEVKAGFFLPLVIGCNVRRSVSLVMQPVTTGRAVKQVEQARTEHAADSAIKNRYGFSLTARAKKEAEAIERREQELAAGFADYRFAGYISVFARNIPELNAACKQVEQLASLSLLDIRRAYGEQREAFLCTLPIGRGCD